MRRTILLVAILLLLLATPLAMAQDAGNPTVAILRLGPLPNYDVIEGGILDVLESYGFITSEDNRILEDRIDHAAAGLNFIWGDADFQLGNASILIEQALDAEVDVFVTLGTSITLAAIAATQDMDAPTPIIFTAVSEPYGTGIAEASCIKPAHVTGSRNTPSYEYALTAIKMQDPDMTTVGAVYSTSEAAGVFGVERLQEAAAELGIEVVTRGVVSLNDLRPATYALAEAGVQSIVLPLDGLATQGLPIVVNIANELGIPVFYPSFSAIYYGATIGAGTSAFYENGINGGRLLVAQLNGDLDIARTGIATAGSLGIGVNLDSAEAQGVVISDALMDDAVAVWEDGQAAKLDPSVLASLARRGRIVPLELRQEGDAAFLATLECTDEMIAEQQAELDAAE